MRYSLLLLLLLLLFNCDHRQSAITEILAADSAFSSLSKKEGMNSAFLHYIDEQGVLLRPNTYPIVGKNKINELFSLQSDSAFTLTWEPLFADAAHSGEMGYSYGKHTLKTSKSTSFGTYVSVWKKVNNQWKFVLDCGNEGLGKEED